MVSDKLELMLNDPRHQGWSVHDMTIHGWEEVVMLKHSDGWIAGVVNLSANSMLYVGPGGMVQYQVKINHKIVVDSDGLRLTEVVVLQDSRPTSEIITSRVDALVEYIDGHNLNLNAERFVNFLNQQKESA